MKLVILSDTHIGRYKYGKINDSGNDSRTDDILSNIDQAIEFSKKNEVDAIIFDGDLYHEKKPLEIYKRLFAKRISKILSYNIHVFILTGNHDQGKTSAHNISELGEICAHVDNLHIIEKPEIISFDDDLEFYMLPHVNRIDLNIQKDQFGKYQLEQIKKLCTKAENSKCKYKLFFGHFGTNISKSGHSFDLGTLSDLDDIVNIGEFDKNVWNKVYLGHIHRQQELNEFCRHVGSIARIDFGEENDQKGFYFWDNGKDSFIKLNDRKFKTITFDLNCDDVKEKMKKECDKMQDYDLSETITRLKVIIKQKDKKIISFKGVEDYLKQSSWTYIGKSIEEIREDKSNIILSETSDELNYQEIFASYVSKLDLKTDLLERVKEKGKTILSEVI